VVAQYVVVARIDQDQLETLLEKVGRVTHEVLVEGIIPGHQKAARLPPPAPAPPGLLPGARNAARVAVQNSGVESPSVYSKFKRVGGDDTQQLPSEQPPLDAAAVFRHVAGAVGHDELSQFIVDLLEALLRVDIDKLGEAAGAGEGQRAGALGDQRREEVGRLPVGAAPGCLLFVH
jgi:hypothetical protein